MERLRGWVRLVFVLGGAWIPLEALLVKHVDPTILIGYALTGFLVYAIGHVIEAEIPA